MGTPVLIMLTVLGGEGGRRRMRIGGEARKDKGERKEEKINKRNEK